MYGGAEVPSAIQLRRPFHTAVLLGVLVLGGVAALTLTPIFFIVLGSFDNAAPGEAVWHFGLRGWQEAFSSPGTLKSIGYSFLLSVRCVIGIAVAFFISWLVVRVRIPLRGLIEFFLWVAYFLPDLPIAVGWILLLDPHYGLINQYLQVLGFKVNIFSVPGIIWVHLTASTIPVMTILLIPALRQMEASFEEAARVCGAGTFQTFKTVLIPVLAPALLTVFLAGLIRSLEAFQIEQLLGTPTGIYVFATRVYDLIQGEPPLFPQAMALSTLFLGILFVLALIYQHATAQRHFATISGHGTSFRPVEIGKWKWIISAFLFLFIVIAVILPLLVLVVGSLMRLFGHFNVSSPFTTRHWILVWNDPVFLSASRNSFILAIGSASLALLLYAPLGYLLARSRIAAKSALSVLVWLPWAVPGLLLGLAFLWLFLSADILSPLYGTFGGLSLVLLIKEMPIGVHMTRTAFHQIDEELEHASEVCGSSWFGTYRRIVLPLIAPMLVTVGLIVFMAALRDISTIVLLSTASTRTLALLMMEYSMGGQMEPASIIGLLLSIFGIMIALLCRRRLHSIEN
ncbi:MAG TPA: iron ABC transporter permease [Candidatus Binatia bacterium]|jgi:iron(III) transport system permease protein|nr:iron ABC transporter permease [Candidatus Binatia bacterium]